MSARGLLFLDSDIFLLLAGASSLGEFIAALGFDASQARRLDPLPHMLARGRLARKYPVGVRQKAEAWCAKIPGAQTAPSSTLLDRLLQVPDLQPGEALLFALAAETESSLVATGDKRACSALNAATGLDEVQSRLRGKVVCMEAALQVLMRRLGYKNLVEATMRVRDLNRTLRVLLPQGKMTPEGPFREALDSYLDHARSLAGSLLWTMD